MLGFLAGIVVLDVGFPSLRYKLDYWLGQGFGFFMALLFGVLATGVVVIAVRQVLGAQGRAKIAREARTAPLRFLADLIGGVGGVLFLGGIAMLYFAPEVQIGGAPILVYGIGAMILSFLVRLLARK
jgi:hypothetical protein